MQKFLLVFLAALMLVTVCSCGNKPNETKSSDGASVSTSSTVPDKKELIYDSTEAFDYAEVDGGVIITYFNNSDYVEYDKIVIPKSIDGKTVVGIGALEKTDTYYGGVFSAIFGNCEVVVPDTITYIGGEAFQGADGLVKLSGGENCTKIGEYAFMNCVNLSEVTFLDNVTDLADNAFAGCTKWESTH